MMAKTLDITPENLQIVQQILQQHIPHYPVWAFGSRTKGTAKPYSDLDLAVIMHVLFLRNTQNNQSCYVIK